MKHVRCEKTRFNLKFVPIPGFFHKKRKKACKASFRKSKTLGLRRKKSVTERTINSHKARRSAKQSYKGLALNNNPFGAQTIIENTHARTHIDQEDK